MFDAFLGPDLSERTLYHGHSYSGNALAAAVALRHLQLLDEWDVLANVRAAVRAAAAACSTREVAPLRRASARSACAGLMGGVELAPPEPRPAVGPPGVRRRVERGVLLRPLGDVVVLMPPLTITADEIDRIVATLRGGDRRGRPA